MRRRNHWLPVAALLAAAAIGFYLSNWPGMPGETQPPPGQVQRFEEEPRISLYVKQTGERRTMPMEEYVAGVVAGEMWEKWPQDAYAAQAILARTFALDLISRGGTRDRHGTDLSTDPTEAQAYNPSKITPVIRRAVESTRGQVLTHEDRYAKAWFHAYSGGQTTTPQEGLGLSGEQPPYLKPVRLPPNPLVPAEFRSWRAEFTEPQIREALGKQGVSVGTIRRMQVMARGPTGRVTEVEVEGSGGSRRISGNDLRVAPGPERMRSTLVRTFRFQDGRLVMEGTGSGHGVGLSQWDALVMARQGRKARDIIATFYPGARIEKLWR